MKLAVLIFYFVAFVPVAGADIPVEHGSQTPPIVSVHFEGGLTHEFDEAVIACIWADGRVIWSRNHDLGGSPYFTGQVDPEQLKAFFVGLHARGLFAREEWGLIITDGATFTINVIDGPQRVLAASSFYEATRPKLPKRITDDTDAVVFLRQQIEALLPPKGQKTRFRYDLRPLK